MNDLCAEQLTRAIDLYVVYRFGRYHGYRIGFWDGCKLAIDTVFHKDKFEGSRFAQIVADHLG